MNTNQNFTDKEILDDILSSQKHIDMLKILGEEHNMQFTAFGEMQKRGWYNPAQAQAQMINETKTKFENIATQL